MTAPQLYARGLGESCPESEYRCFFCGASCDDAHSATIHVSNSFIGFGDVAQPASKFVCHGCVLATREKIEIPGYDKLQKVRNFSWIITANSVKSYTKANLDVLRETCINPPSPPFAIVLAVSGQKQLIYRAAVNESRDEITVQFETDQVSYRPEQLIERLTLCHRICAATGKPAMTEPPTASLSIRLAHHFREFEPLTIWYEIWQEPLSRLAAFLCINKEGCLNEFPCEFDDPKPAPGVRRQLVSAPAGGIGGPGLFG